MTRYSIIGMVTFAPALLTAQATQSAAPTIVPMPATTLPLKHAAEPTSADINVKDLMTRLYIFADDSMQGREAGKIGNVKGTDYIAAEAKKIGLVPAGDNGTYFQTIPFKTRAVDSASTLAAGGASLAFGREWVAIAPATVSLNNAPVIYGGSLGDSMLALTPEQAAGKVVVFNLLAGQNPRVARDIQKRVEGAAGILLIAQPQVMGFLRRPSQFVDDPANAPKTPPRATIYVTADAVSKLFDTPMTQLTSGAAGKPISLDLKLKIDPTPFPARNVVGILPGSDEKLKGEFVAIGGHNDHIGFNNRPVDHDSIRIFNHIVRPGGAEDGGKQANADQQAEVNKLLAEWRAAHPGTMRADSISNGADDDGTGTVSVLEIAEKLAAMKTKPKRSTLFVWHVGEEKGLLGSAYYTDHPTVARDSIVAQLNIDMVGRGDAWDVTGQAKEGGALRGSSNYLQLVGSRRLSTELGDLAEKVNAEGKHGLSFDYGMDANGHPMNIYCRSDHYEYARYGIPIIFFTTGGHSDYHQVTDEPQYIDYAHMARVDNFIADLAVRVSNLDHRVVVDQPKPDPKGACRQ
ncbi:MAG: M28 family peptidase [Gemmatimonadota bacterium]|nr:M28 family peptidase [Gemmatimonadota bacterium]